MSSPRVSYIRKRRSDEESSDSDSEDEAPPIKKFRKYHGDIKQLLATKFVDIFKWISYLPLKSYFKDTMLKASLKQPIEVIVMEEDEKEKDVIDISDDDDEEDIDDDIDVIDIADDDEADVLAIEKGYSIPNKRPGEDTLRINTLCMTPNPLTSSTPFYKDHKASHERTLKSLSRKPVNGFHSKSSKTKNQKSHYNQHRTPITNPAADVEILLDTRGTQAEESDDLEIVTEVTCKKPDAIPGQRISSMTHKFGATSKDFFPRDSFLSDKASPTERQSPFNKSYTAHEVVRLQEKAQYQLLLDKIVSGNTYRPVLPTKVTKPVEVQVDLTQDDKEPVASSRSKRESLEQPVNEFLQKYYKPYQLKAAVLPQTTMDHKNIFTDDKDDELQVMDVKIPSYKPKHRSKPDFFSPEWISELKSTITAETEQRLELVTAQEQKLERYRLRREGKFSLLGIPPTTKILSSAEEFPEITPSMEEIILDAFDVANKNPSEDVAKIEDCGCNRNDLLTLSGLSWLNDCVINFYLKLIKKRNSESDGKLPSVYAFSSYFYTVLKNKGEQHVMRWTRKLDIFSYDLLFVPLHFGMHWALCVVDNRTKTIKYYDSMHGTNDDCLKLILNFLVAEMKGKKNQILNPETFDLEIVKDIPQQMNGSDCGMFTLKYAEYISRDAPITFSQDHMQYFRRRMIIEIMQKKLFN